MSIPPQLSIVVPVYNEPENIGPTLHRIADAVRTPHEVVVVYDFAQDATVPVVRELQVSMPGVRLHRNDLGRGVLSAMRSGMAASRAPFVLITMADGSDEMTHVDRMVDLARRGAVIVAGSRYMKGGGQVGGPFIKRTLSRMAGLSLYWLARVPIHDATNNFKLYRRDFLESVAIESTGGFELAIELTAKATLAGHSIAEVPTTWRERSAGDSRFLLRSWLPKYVRWYAYIFRGRLSRLIGG
jgi:glycosyltransferase involved in cell wall biosynthesis